MSECKPLFNSWVLKVDFSSLPIYNGTMKRALTILIAIFLLIPALSAEKVYWVGFEGAERNWSNSELLAFTDLYEEGSDIVITIEGGESVIVTVKAPLPETVEGRDIALTESALKDLGIWGEGPSEATVRLKKGAEKEKEEEKQENTGWYSFLLSPVSSDSAYSIYRTLIRRGFKVEAERSDDGLFHFTLPYIVEYERDAKRKVLLSLSLEIEEERPSINPYMK